MLAPRSVIVAIVVVATLDACTTHRDDNRSATPGVTRAPFGRLPDGRVVELFTLTNAHGVEVRAMTYGGIITVIRTPDRNGQLDDIVLGFDRLAGYLGDSPYFGAIVGRYANRIARGQFTLDGVTYRLARNNGPNSLHGGVRGFDKVLWVGEPLGGDSVGVRFRYTSRDGEEGYPGSVAVSVTYTLTSRDELVVDYEASTDNGTPIGARIEEPNVQLRYGRGYDHNWVLDRAGPAGLAHAARLVDPTSGRALNISTTEPGIQFYSGNFLDGTIRGKGRQVYEHRTG